MFQIAMCISILITITIKGFFRTSGVAGTFATDGEYKPFKAVQADRFKLKKVFNSFRISPSDDSISENVRDDTTALEVYAWNVVKKNSVKQISGSLSLQGRKYWSIGTMLDSVITEFGTTNIGLAMIDIQVNFEGVHTPNNVSGDITNIQLGSK